MGRPPSLDNQLFNLKFTSKQLSRMAKKSEKAEKAQKLKLKKAIEQGNVDGARIYAQNAIREKNTALNYLRLASRIDAVASRVEGAIRMQQVTRSMAGVVRGMDKAMESMDLKQITAVMDKFEKQFEDLDVQSEYVEGAISESTTLSTPQTEVDTLISQVADEHGLQLAGALGTTPSSVPVGTKDKEADEADELSARLERLKAGG